MIGREPCDTDTHLSIAVNVVVLIDIIFPITISLRVEWGEEVAKWFQMIRNRIYSLKLEFFFLGKSGHKQNEMSITSPSLPAILSNIQSTAYFCFMLWQSQAKYLAYSYQICM